MPDSLDLQILPLVRSGGRDQPGLPGLHIASAPRRPARGRSDDRLILFLDYAGAPAVMPRKQEEALARLAKTYYETPGSVTSAMRAVADTLNQMLLDSNVQGGYGGRQSLGILTQIVLRAGQVYIAQSGVTPFFQITADRVLDLSDPDMVGRGLGQGRATPVRFLQLNPHPDQFLLLVPQSSINWSESLLSSCYGQTIEHAQSLLLTRAGSDYMAALIRITTGTGKISPVSSGVAPSALKQDVVDDRSTEEKAFSWSPPPGSENVQTIGTEQTPAPLAETAAKSPVVTSVVSESGSLPASKEPPVTSKKASTQPKATLKPLANMASAVGKPLSQFSQRVAHGLKVILGRLLPEEGLATISSSTMAAVAITVPLVVVAVAVVIYIQRGVVAQSAVLYEQAAQSASQAEAQADPTSRRTALLEALNYLDQADYYWFVPQSAQLRAQVLDSLDSLDLIRRADYKPAVVGGIPDTVKISRMIISGGDLYLLDGSSSMVLRAYTTNRGFEIDRTFQCGPGILTGQAIGLVEKPSKGGGTGGILTVDTEGNAAICSPGLEPELTVLMSPPSITFSHLAAITQDLGDLYVLDPQSRAVWVYSNSDVTREPVNFFTDESPSMDGVIDLSVNNDELYLLHEDGHMTFCLSARMDVSPSRCPSPPPSFVDLRPGRENLLMQLDYPFSQILYATPPDPSLYFLEPFTQSVYHFSLRTLTFQRQILPKSSLKDELATAFFVNHIDRTIYLAIDNNVYYANIP